MSVAARPAPGSLAAAVDDADAHATVLDDLVDVEEQAIFLWLRGRRLHAHALHRLAIGCDLLPAPWRARTRRFTQAADAEAFLRRAAHDPHDVIALRALGRTGGTSPLADADLVRELATALVSGAVWVLEVKRPRSRFIGKTDPEVFASINPKHRTAVDFGYIAGLEGDQWRRGYVPFRKGVVAGRSGMTVASGFDVGQWAARQFDALGFPAALSAKLRPFTQHAFKGMRKPDVAKAVAAIAPVPVLTKAEADLCDGVVFDQVLGDAIGEWKSRRSPPAPEFQQLPGAWQTVWLSRVYQEGPQARSRQAVAFRNAARAGRWQEAVTALRSYTQYVDRATQEANLLSSAMPAAPPPAPAAGMVRR